MPVRTALTLQKTRLSLLGVGVFVLLGLGSCGPEELIFPVEPQIEFVRITPSVVREGGSIDADSIEFAITIKYQDGDGDLGSDDATDYNFFMQDLRTDRLPAIIIGDLGDTLAVYDGLIPSSMPSLTPDARTPSIQGEITITLTTGLVRLPLNNPPATDTTRFEIYIVDRAGNESNRVQTPLITILPQN